MKNVEKVGIEIERKFVIKMPDVLTLRSQKDYTVSEILQIYLKSEQGETRRVRRRVYSDRTLYIETKKIRIDNMSSEEIERGMSKNEFDALASSPLEGTNPIRKLRHTFVYEGQLFEIDIYPEWGQTAVMETELPTRDTDVSMPPFIEIIKEVTGDKSYSNASMSKSFPEELI